MGLLEYLEPYLGDDELMIMYNSGPPRFLIGAQQSAFPPSSQAESVVGGSEALRNMIGVTILALILKASAESQSLWTCDCGQGLERLGLINSCLQYLNASPLCFPLSLAA